MTPPIDRRQVLRTSAGAAVLAGLGTAATATAASAATASPAAPSASRRITPKDGPEIPTVPGMNGDPRSNEFWYVFDQELWYHRTPEVIAANEKLGEVLGEDPEVAIVQAYLAHRSAGTYPSGFRTLVTPLKDALTVLSDAQWSVIDRYYPRTDPAGLTKAFADFGQGVLYDPRLSEGQRSHTMNGNPPVGFHAWHCYLRAMQLLGIDSRRWAPIDPLIGLSWEIQSIVKPKPDVIYPPMAPGQLRTLTAKWLSRSPAQVDTAFETFPYPQGVS
ncbi:MULTISPECIES: hypothetical protein [unclassified Streptomyces]|uniref:hypothetical protein n=1 Tax=unclassified Streptomyces TaxID=2593676 RepID=UPI00380B4D3E